MLDFPTSTSEPRLLVQSPGALVMLLDGDRELLLGALLADYLLVQFTP